MTLNIANLVPEKYDNSQIMQALIDALEYSLGICVQNIDGLKDLINPNNVPDDYLQYLADLIGITLTSTDDATDAQRRTELIQAIDWIKRKGTYQAIKVIGLIKGIHLEFADMWTNDYVNFIPYDWAEEPTDNLYYKSPHFGAQVVLNIEYPIDDEWSHSYLFKPSLLSDISSYVEKTRPINTVPHYYALFQPQTGNDNILTSTDWNVKTLAFGDWTVNQPFFDDGLYFDDSVTPVYFDASREAFYQSITKWVLGTGNKDASPSDSGWDIETQVLTGTVDRLVISPEQVRFEIIVPATAQNGISELALYIPGSPDTLAVGSCFPDINLDSTNQLRISVIIDLTI